MTLKELRSNVNMTQGKVAKKLDIDQSAISHWERGTTMPCRKYRRKLSEIYRCSEEDIAIAVEEVKKCKTTKEED